MDRARFDAVLVYDIGFLPVERGGIELGVDRKKCHEGQDSGFESRAFTSYV
jgi:hypothetical protein